jgi:hypothetical protein
LRPSLSNSVDVITTSSGINLISSFGVYRSSEKTRKIVSKSSRALASSAPARIVRLASAISSRSEAPERDVAPVARLELDVPEIDRAAPTQPQHEIGGPFQPRQLHRTNRKHPRARVSDERQQILGASLEQRLQRVVRAHGNSVAPGARHVANSTGQ